MTRPRACEAGRPASPERTVGKREAPKRFHHLKLLLHGKAQMGVWSSRRESRRHIATGTKEQNRELWTKEGVGPSTYAPFPVRRAEKRGRRPLSGIKKSWGVLGRDPMANREPRKWGPQSRKGKNRSFILTCSTLPAPERKKVGICFNGKKELNSGTLQKGRREKSGRGSSSSPNR